MAFPADVKLVRVTCGTGYDFSGDPIAITLEVTPVLGGSLKRLVHAATGTFMTRDALTFKSDPGSPATFTVPSPAQAETWKDGSGEFFTNWSYSVTVTTRTSSGKIQSWIQSFQPVAGQDTVDLDLVPDGQIGSPTSAPAPAVTSVNGQSGAVVIDVGEAVTPESVAANLTVDAVDAKLPERLSESSLSAAIVKSRGSNLARFIQRCRSGEPVKIVAVGDSILEGTTVTADGGVVGVDDCLSQVATRVSARFGNTVTPANHAMSGHTVAIGPLSALWDSAVAEKGDLYLIDYLTNDLSGELADTPIPGYPLDAFTAGMERLFRRIRKDVPKADIAFLIANPYNGGENAGNNPTKKLYNQRVLDVCATYGVEVVDGFSAFANLGSYGHLMADTTHPNSAGHHLLADEVMKHLPASVYGMGHIAGPISAKGLHSPEKVDTSIGDTGASYVLVPTAPMWVETGTWAAPSGYRETVTVGDKISGTGNFTELYAMIDTADAKNLHATLRIDGVDVFTNADMTLGKQGAYWVPLVTGLAPGSKTYEFILTAGTMQVRRVGWLAGAAATTATFENPYVRTSQLIPYTNNVVTLPTDGATHYIYGSLLAGDAGVKYIDMPAGWGEASVVFQGNVDFRILATTTTPRQVTLTIRHNGSIIHSQVEDVAATAVNLRTPSLAFVTPPALQSVSRRVSVEVKVSSTDKTNVQVMSYGLAATLYRTA